MKTRTLSATALLLLVLTGCAGAPEEAPTSEQVDGESATPLVAETAQPADEPETDDEKYLSLIRETLPDDTVIPDATDAQLLEAAAQACEQMNGGIDVSAVDVVEGEKANDLGIRESSARIAAAAKDVYCPQGY